ncbi:hypothetical protein [Sinorhizobium meliloti]|nr:hypothetical protein [Sinorhizobium meliloti]MCO5963693.1 hypothetical protein [Sinorhizobium meliloti]
MAWNSITAKSSALDENASSVMQNIDAIVAVASGYFDAARAYIEGFE